MKADLMHADPADRDLVLSRSSGGAARTIALGAGTLALVALVAGLVAWATLGRGHRRIDIMHPSTDWTPSTQHYCEMAGESVLSLQTPQRTGLEAGYAQVVSDYAPATIHGDAQVVATALEARRDHRKWDQVKALRAAAHVDAYTKQTDMRLTHN
jgi:hypothetical protein